MNPTELKAILDSHARWYRGDATGQRAYLQRAYLQRADLQGAYLQRANLSGAYLSGANLGVDPAKLIIPEIDAQIAFAIGGVDGQGPDGCALEMSTWHTCQTTHCRAGWAVTLAGEAGKALESTQGTATAGAKPIPDFYADNETAMESILNDAVAR